MIDPSTLLPVTADKVHAAAPTATAARGELSEQPALQNAGLTDPFSIFVLAIRSAITREKYLQRIGYFFDFLRIPMVDESGKTIPIEKRFNIFSKGAIKDINQLTNNIMKYSQHHRQRVERKEITGSTLRMFANPSNYFANRWILKYPGRRLCEGCPKEGGTRTTELLL